MLNAAMTLMTVSTLVFTIHTITLADAAIVQVSNLARDVGHLQTIQLSQASYAEKRLNTLSERLDTSTNHLHDRVSILEARRLVLDR
ncbi:hypothetical protein IFT47_03185 [Pseudomonas sp. CFBP 13711]|uniref:hypothetical protein n=1 Tax=unclassified Pseudomonas TaxID=196821 RepID=UPI0017849D36|nr:MULTISPECIES: hypothetical protein [unclassified Pseudomonas]MBD8705634.1 hypothetical protein [Pseudomonas sp. CFBP 13711]MBD8710667.1 hypothetical protein [Pseudomonas sp. CFBP 13715]